MKTFIKIFILLTVTTIIFAQEFNVPVDLINTPTAGTLGKGYFSTEMRFATRGGVLGGIQVGIADRFDIGLSYGGGRIVGNEKIIWNKQPGVLAKFRILDEGNNYPGVAVGFNSQGYGEYIDSLELYEIRSLGAYAVASKNWETIFNSQLGLHLGMNYSFEQPDSVRVPSVFMGISWELSPQFGIFIEYDSAIDYKKYADIDNFKITRGSGFLNAGIRIGISDEFYVECDFNNLIFGENVESFNREIKLKYISSF